LYAYYKVIAFPKEGEKSARVLQLDKSKLEKRYFLEEYVAGAVMMAAGYGTKMPDIRAIVRDAVSYLNRDSNSKTAEPDSTNGCNSLHRREPSRERGSPNQRVERLSKIDLFAKLRGKSTVAENG